MVILSIGSRFLRLCDEARAAQAIIQLTSSPSATYGSRIVNWFAVKVPVLSEHKTSTPCVLSVLHLVMGWNDIPQVTQWQSASGQWLSASLGTLRQQLVL